MHNPRQARKPHGSTGSTAGELSNGEIPVSELAGVKWYTSKVLLVQILSGLAWMG
jgi:hypothetical protein